MSLSGKSPYPTTRQLSVQATDNQGNAVSATPVYVEYKDVFPLPFRLSTAQDGFPLPTNSDGIVATVSTSGLITARSVGQTVIEVQVPFGGNTIGNQTTGMFTQRAIAVQAVSAQIVVTVVQ